MITTRLRIIALNNTGARCLPEDTLANVVFAQGAPGPRPLDHPGLTAFGF
jgi:hypothetical protein